MGQAPKSSRPQTTEWYRRLIDEVQDYAIFLVDHDGRVVSWNTGAERLLGWTEEDILGQSSFVVFVPEDIAKGDHLRELEKAAAEGRAENERWHQRQDGSRFWGSGIMTGIRDDAGALIGFGKIMRDRTAQRQLEEELRASLQEKEVLLREIHHRVKNNLQVISSVLSLQSETVGEGKALAVFQDAQARIHSTALIHEILHQSSNLAEVNLAAYTRRLAEELLRSYQVEPERLRLVMETDEVWLSAEKAMPCGLILNELIANCVKHAFPDNRSGTIRVTLRAEAESQVTLSVADGGVGFPPELDFRHTESLGLQLICLLTEQLAGTITLDRSEGTLFTIRFAVEMTPE
jgi:PAS domain S-box-containing protein